jgi:uncharacterized OB-fold protein
MNPSETPWRERAGRVHLLACKRPGRAGLQFPPLPPNSPLAAGSEMVELSATGRLYSFTVVHAAPKLQKPPVPLGLVDFAEGVRVFGRMHYPADRRPVIGETLRVVLDESEQGPIYAFEPEPK